MTLSHFKPITDYDGIYEITESDFQEMKIRKKTRKKKKEMEKNYEG